MGRRDRYYGWGDERDERGQGRYTERGVYRSGDNEEDYGGRSGYERSRGREHLGGYPQSGDEYRTSRSGYSSRDRDLEAFGGYGGRGGEGFRAGRTESGGGRGRGRDYRGDENRNPYYGGGGMFGGGMGGYTGGGYLGGGFEGSAIDNETEEERAYRRQNFSDRRGYEARDYRDRGGYGRGDLERGRRDDRDEGFFDRMADTVSSWFGYDDEDRDDRRGLSHRGRGPKGYTRSDDRIREDVNDDLTYHVGLDASDIEVEVNNGEVILTGNVRSRYEKRLAEDITEDVRGVTHVENRIRVQQRGQWGSGYTHTGTGGAMTAGSGLGTESPGTGTSAEDTGTSTTGTSRGRSAGGTS